MDVVDQAVTLNEIEDIVFNGIPVGIHSLATYTSGMPTARIDLDSDSKKKLKKIIKQSIRASVAAEKIINYVKPQLVLSTEKGTVGTCEIFYESIKHCVDYVQYLSCHEPHTVMLKRYNPTAN